MLGLISAHFAALQISMQEAATTSDAEMSKVLGDQNFVSSILSSVRITSATIFTCLYILVCKNLTNKPCLG